MVTDSKGNNRSKLLSWVRYIDIFSFALSVGFVKFVLYFAFVYSLSLFFLSLKWGHAFELFNIGANLIRMSLCLNLSIIINLLLMIFWINDKSEPLT